MAIKVVPEFNFPAIYKDVYNVLFNNDKDDLLDLFSGRNSGKSYNMYGICVSATFMEKDNNILILRASKTQIMKSVFTLMLNIIYSKKLDKFFKIRRKAMQIENLITGSIIYFDGIEDDPDRIKGFTPRNNKISMVIFEEFTEMNNDLPISIATETLVRFKGSDYNNGHIKIVKMGNPSRWNSHWSWDMIEADSKNPKCKIFSPMWTDIVDFLEKPTIEYILTLKLTNNRYYQWAYEGKRLSYDGLVYQMFDERVMVSDTDHFETKMPIALLCGLDPASKRDKTAFIIGVLYNSGQVVFKDMWCHNPKEVDSGQLSPSQQGERIIKFLNDFLMRPENYNFRYLPKIIITDPASGGLDVEIRANYGHMVEVLTADKKDRLQDIARNQNAMSTGRIKFERDVPNLKPLLDELSMMIWRDKAIAKELKVVKSTTLTIGEDDCHDAMTYVITFALTNARFMAYNANYLNIKM